jgi:hypothetical protein
VAACGDDISPSPGHDAGSLPRFELGTGPESGPPRFDPVADGQDLLFAPGSQGGFHVPIVVRFGPADQVSLPEEVELYMEGRRRDTGELVTRRETIIDPVEDAEGALISDGPILVFLCPVPVGIDVGDQLLDLRFEFSDRGTPLGIGELSFVPRCPPDEDFCRRICFDG